MVKLPVLAAALGLLVGACAATDSMKSRDLPPKPRYVAMGSSYASGVGIGERQANTPERCYRSVSNYAMLLAARRNLELTDASCSGATTDHVLGPWNELPAQINAVTSDTRLVTITIGGNDLRFAAWLRAASCRAGAIAEPCGSVPLPSEADYAKLDRNLRAIAQEVRRRAPAARLVFVPYVALNSGKPCPLETIAPADAAAARIMAQRLAATTRAAARDNRADVVDVDMASKDHTPCSPIPWSLGFPSGYERSQGAPWHPNAAGHAAIADMLDTLLAKS
jgi:lysophospholipase L1-like esterase